METSSGQQQPNNAGITHTLRQYFEGIPLGTRLVLLVCVLVFVAEALLGPTHRYVCHRPEIIIYKHEVRSMTIDTDMFQYLISSKWFRLVTPAIFHANILHLLFNMLALVQTIGPQLEGKVLGTLQFLWLCFLFQVLGGFLHAFVALVLSLKYADFMSHCTIGLSGVLFSLLVLKCHLAPQPFSFFGFGKVPAAIYPILSLVLAQLLIPRASLIGHFCGLLVGYAYVSGVIGWMAIPSAFLNHIESTNIMGLFMVMDGYIPNPALGLPLTSGRTEGCFASCREWIFRSVPTGDASSSSTTSERPEISSPTTVTSVPVSQVGDDAALSFLSDSTSSKISALLSLDKGKHWGPTCDRTDQVQRNASLKE